MLEDHACMHCHSVISDSLWPHGQYSLWGSTVHGIFQARTLEWIAISYFRGCSWPRDQTLFSCMSSINRCFVLFCFVLITSPPGKPLKDHEDILSVSLVLFSLLSLESHYRESVTVFPCNKAKALPRKRIQGILHSMVPPNSFNYSLYIDLMFLQVW